MADARKIARATSARVVGLVAALAFALGIGAGVTSASWVDQDYFSATATSSTYDIQSRFSALSAWEDVGLPGNPDTFPDGAEVIIPPILDALPEHSYLADVFICNAGNVDGRITFATLEEVRSFRGTLSSEQGIVIDSSIEVDGIDIGTIIPANSCQPGLNPPNDVEGVIHFTTVPDFTGLYSVTSQIVIKIGVTSQ